MSTGPGDTITDAGVSSASDRSALRTAQVWLVGVALALVYAPTAGWLWQRWTMSVWHNAHGLLIPPVVAYLVWLELREKRSLPVSSSALGFVFLVPALLMHVLDTGMHTQLLSAASIVLILPGLSLLFFGLPRTKAITFPLAFTLFALPIPLSLTERLHLILRHLTTDGVAAIIPFLGVPVFAEETTLHTAKASLIVADACSGFSTLYAAAAVACLTAYQSDGWRRLLVLVSAPPLAVAANIIRVMILVAVTAHSGTDVLQTWIHPASGMLTFVLALPVIFWLGQAGRPGAPPAGPAATPAPPAVGAGSLP